MPRRDLEHAAPPWRSSVGRDASLSRPCQPYEAEAARSAAAPTPLHPRPQTSQQPPPSARLLLQVQREADGFARQLQMEQTIAALEAEATRAQAEHCAVRARAEERERPARRRAGGMPGSALQQRLKALQKEEAKAAKDAAKVALRPPPKQGSTFSGASVAVRR